MTGTCTRVYHRRMSARSQSLLLVAAVLAPGLAAACGSVVVEPSPDGGSAGGTSTSTATVTTTVTGTGGTTTTTTTTNDGGDECSSASDCPSAGLCELAACENGVCTVVAQPLGTSCSAGVCDGIGQCWECLADADCAPGDQCASNNVCVSPCMNGVQDGDETGVDCGGSCFFPCQGPPCAGDLDCASAYCKKGICREAILITELRSSGPGGISDEFVELQNPGSVPIVLDSTWLLYNRSAEGACHPPVLRYQGKGQIIPPLGRLLLRGQEYSQSPAADDLLENSAPAKSMADAASLWIVHGPQIIDALCYSYDAATLATLTTGCGMSYTCMGTPAENLPHDGTGMGPSAADVSLVRKVDALGNPLNTRNNAVDFESLSPAAPQSSMSP